MKLIKVRVNRTIECEVSVPVEEDHRYEQVKNYLETIDWENEIFISPQNFEQIAKYYEWIDWETDNEGRLTNRNLKLRDY